jgi:hypothetical protein
MSRSCRTTCRRTPEDTELEPRYRDSAIHYQHRRCAEAAEATARSDGETKHDPKPESTDARMTADVDNKNKAILEKEQKVKAQQSLMADNLRLLDSLKKEVKTLRARAETGNADINRLDTEINRLKAVNLEKERTIMDQQAILSANTSGMDAVRLQNDLDNERSKHEHTRLTHQSLQRSYRNLRSPEMGVVMRRLPRCRLSFPIDFPLFCRVSSGGRPRVRTTQDCSILRHCWRLYDGARRCRHGCGCVG